jgi:hypothetical protein
MIDLGSTDQRDQNAKLISQELEIRPAAFAEAR